MHIMERDVLVINDAVPGFEGAGFPVRRAFAGLDLRLTDPFLMLDHLGEVGAGDRVRAAVARVIEQDMVRTRDLGGTASTTEFGDAVVRRIA